MELVELLTLLTEIKGVVDGLEGLMDEEYGELLVELLEDLKDGNQGEEYLPGIIDSYTENDIETLLYGIGKMLSYEDEQTGEMIPYLKTVDERLSKIESSLVYSYDEETETIIGYPAVIDTRLDKEFLALNDGLSLLLGGMSFVIAWNVIKSAFSKLKSM